MSGGFDGYYNDHGIWIRTKFCLVSCGDRCTCMPPGNRYYSREHDKILSSRLSAQAEPNNNPLRGISMENVRR